MANKRCITLDIVDNDNFLELPLTAQALYFHICVRADDDGFCANPKKTLRMLGATEEDLQKLIEKEYILVANKGVLLVKHWWMHNTKRKDTYKASPHLKDNPSLATDENESYVSSSVQVRNESVTENRNLVTSSEREMPKAVTQIKLNKTKLNKTNINKIKLNEEFKVDTNTASTDTDTQEEDDPDNKLF